jgi:hypothetical protein
MRNLPKSSGADDSDTTLDASQETRAFTIGTGIWLFSIHGTWAGNIVTLKVSSNDLPTGTFRNYAVKDSTGVLTDQTFTDDIHHGYIEGGGCYKFVSDATGSPDLDIKVAPGPGNSITIHNA